VGFTKVMRDQNERAQAGEAAAHLAAIITSSDDAIISKDLRGIIRTWNKGAERLFGYPAREVIGKPMALLIPEDRADEGPEILERIERGEVVEHYETVRRRKDGSLLDVSLTVSPVRDGAGRVIGAAKIARDVTQRKRVAEQIRESEERYRSLFAAAPMAVFVCDRDAVIQHYNARAVKLWGREPVCGVERHWGSTKLWRPDGTLLPDPQSPIMEVLRTGIPVSDVEVCIERPDGSRLPVLVNFAPLRNAKGEVTGAVTAFIDITQRQRAEEQIRESEARFRSIFETSEVSIWEQDLTAVKQLVEELKAEHGPGLRDFLLTNPAALQQAVALVRINDVNPATLRMFEASSKERLLASLSKILPPETQSALFEELIALDEGRRLFSTEAALRTMSGRPIHVLLTMNFPPAHEKPERVLVTLVDISARKVAEVEREARIAEMEVSLNFSEMFVGILGHDLRNPLGAIIMASELLLLRETSERIARPIQRIHTSAERMTRMLDQILDLTQARIGGGIPIEPTPVDLQALAAQLVEELDGAISQRVVLESVGEMRGEWDRDRLAQIISNLLGNAVEHGEPNQSIRVKLDGSEPEVVRLSLSNAGVIPQQLFSTLFDPFRRAPATDMARKSKGLGLGLFIAHQVAQAHGGSIDVRSSADDGTTFSVCLPRNALPRVCGWGSKVQSSKR
jgi:PAS domain S-box-containing protein